MVARETLFPKATPGGGGSAISGKWDASAVTVITNSVAREFLAATMVTNSESSYDLVPDATAIYNAVVNSYFSEAADPALVLKSGVTWSRITAPSIDAGDNTFGFVFGIKNTGETGADALAKVFGATPVAAGDFEALFLLEWNATNSNFNFSLGYVNDGVTGQAALPAVTSGQTVYFGIDWDTGTLYYQIDAGAVTTTGVTLSAGFEALDWNTFINVHSSANPVVFLAGSVNFDLSDETGTHTPFISSGSSPADYPPSPANKMYEVSGAGTVDNTALSVGDIVVFDADGLSFTRLNDATHITSSTLSNESGVPGPTVKDALDSLNLTKIEQTDLDSATWSFSTIGNSAGSSGAGTTIVDVAVNTFYESNIINDGGIIEFNMPGKAEISFGDRVRLYINTRFGTGVLNINSNAPDEAIDLLDDALGSSTSVIIDGTNTFPLVYEFIAVIYNADQLKWIGLRLA